MKTLQLVPAMEQGGVERGVVEMNRVIVGAGWENVVVSAGGRLAGQIAQDGGRHIACDVKSKNPLTFFARAARLRRILAAERPDVVCAHSRVPAWLFRRAGRGLGIPWITFAHGANSIGWYSKVMTAGDLTVTPSQYIADYLHAAYGTPMARMRVIPRAIEAERFDPSAVDAEFIAGQRAAWKTDGFRVVMGVGRITQLKGYDVLIHALAYLHHTHVASGKDTPDYKLVIVGEAEALRKDYETTLKELVRTLGVEDNVVFAGNQRKIAECLTIADVVVSANWKKPEAFGRSMAEALAMNRPVVATAFGGALDIVEDGVNGALVGVPDARSTAQECAIPFANAIRAALRLPKRDWRTPTLEKFSFGRMAASSLAVYRELAARKEENAK
ncbi:MAG: glycosyltransferase [Kiritimatiellia bacterium]